MKKKVLLVSLVAALIASSTIIPVSAATAVDTEVVSNAEAANAAVAGDVKLDEATFPDAVFREYLKSNYDKNKDGNLSKEEVAATREIKLGNSSVTNLKGIENLTELTYLEVMGTGITELDVSKNTKLTLIDCADTKISNLDLSNNTALKTLWCYNAPITKLDLSKNTSLGVLRASGTAITELDLSNNKELTYLECDGTNITELSLANNSKLQWLTCADTKVQNLDIKNLSDLRRLEVQNTGITNLDVTKNNQLVRLDCSNTQISDLNLTNNGNLQVLICADTGLNTLDISKNAQLAYFDLHNTNISNLNVDGLLNLEYLDISNTKFTNLDVSNNDKLKSLKYDNTPLISLNLGNNSHLQDSTGIVQAQRLEVTGGSFHLAQYFPTLDLTKIVNVTGATLTDGVVSNYLPGQPVTYSYSAGTGANGQPINLTVTLNLMITNVWEQEISASDMVLGEKVNVSAKPVFGDVQYVYSQQENGVYTADEPTTAGVWYVKAMVNGSEFLTALESQPVAFNVTQPVGVPGDSNQGSNTTDNNKEMVNNVKTGDETTIGLLASIFAASVGILASLKVFKKKKESN
ncbi:MAG: hypothetical protein KHX91_05515 [Clostridium sp.]|nr:hypothetical protein [Clostridium sp.]